MAEHSAMYREQERESKKWHWQKKGEIAVRALRKKGYDARYFYTGQEAAKTVIELAASAQSIGVGGSMTVMQLNILDVLEKQGKTIYPHWAGLAPGSEEDLRVRRASLTCDLFLASANALTLKGEIVNMDGAGNRTNAMTFGPRKVVLLVGVNKLVKDIDDGIKRIYEVAAPLNCQRGGFKSPCSETGICAPAAPGDHICCITSIMNRKPRLTDISVFVIAEELGF